MRLYLCILIKKAIKAYNLKKQSAQPPSLCVGENCSPIVLPVFPGLVAREKKVLLHTHSFNVFLHNVIFFLTLPASVFLTLPRGIIKHFFFLPTHHILSPFFYYYLPTLRFFPPV